MYSDLPLKLFHGNPNLIEISIRGNDLRTLDAAQFPLDRLHRLRLADNPLVCNCSLLWLWRLTTGHVNDANHNDPSTGGSTATASATAAASMLTQQPVPSNNNQNNNNSNNSKPTTVTKNNNNKNHNASQANLLLLDSDDIACDLWEDSIKVSRHIMKTMSSSDIKCPANIVTVISAIVSILLIVMTGASVLYYMRRQKNNKKTVLAERKNVNERIVPQQVDKLELERYLAAQEMANEYRALRQWELSCKEHIEEPDHYEKFDDFRFDTRRSQKPHVVYV